MTNGRDSWTDLAAPDGSHMPTSVRNRIQWYAQNAADQRIKYYLAEVAVILLSAAIPAGAALGAGPKPAAVLGALVVVVGGLRHLWRWGENWIRSSKTLIDLQAEVARWSQGLPPYDSSTATSELAGRVEAIVAGETASWATALQASGHQPAAG